MFIRLATTLAAVSIVHGQQFHGYELPHHLFDLGHECFTAVNSTVSSCPAWLPRYAGLESSSVEILPSEQLSILCGSSCQGDLLNLRASITKACKASTDVMVQDQVTRPATFLVDRYLYAASLSCLKDKSGKYCDTVVAGWANRPNETNYECSQCELGVQQLQLGSPFGFSDALAQAFAKTTKSCGASGYGYATPTSLVASATAPAPSPTCTGSEYTIKEGDSCVTISEAHDVSTFQLITENHLNIGCNNLPAAGQSICLPSKNICHTYQLQLYDTCGGLMKSWNATMSQVQAWNPMINSVCSNLASWRGWYLCSTSPSGTASVSPGNAATTAVPRPKNAQSQSNAKCAKWYPVKTGDYCAALSLKYNLALPDFYFLNPRVDSKCSNLWANTSYCVEPEGDITTYSGYNLSKPATTFTRPATATDFVPSPVQTPALCPKASGTIGGCYRYENAFDSTSRLKNLSAANSCSQWARFAETTVDQLVEWNPSLSAGNCVLQAGKSYCVQKSDSGRERKEKKRKS